MRIVRIVVAVVLFFLMFALPALLGFQFLASSRPGASVGGEGALASLGRTLRRLLGGGGSPGRGRGRQGRPAGNASAPGSPGSGQAQAGGAQEQAAAAPGGAEGLGDSTVSAAAYILEEFGAGGGSIEEIRAAQAQAASAAAGAGPSAARGDPGWRTPQGGAAAGGKRPMSAVRAGAAGSSNEPWARGSGGAQRARLEITDPLTTPGGQQLTNAGVQGSQAVNMAGKLHLLDGAKDHAGKTFDGNWNVRKGIPLEKYQDSFGHQSIGVKNASAQGPVDLH